MTSYIRYDVKSLLAVYWDLWLAPGIDFEIIWLYRPTGKEMQS